MRIRLFSCLAGSLLTLGLLQCAAAADALPAGWPQPVPVPGGEMGEAVRWGERILTQTPEALPGYSGNDLNCTSCHLNGGRTPHAAPWVGIWSVFPEYRPRNARVNLLEDRINDCLERSANGRALPAGSPEMRAMQAYMQWLSQGTVVGQSLPGRGFARLPAGLKPDPVHGAQVYQEKCALCHGADGQGQRGPGGERLFPPLWGPRSFNIGAGMARLNTAAAFVKANMPLGQGGSLGDQEALDVAAFFTRQPRPDFAAKGGDWPRGGKPADARY
jgi:thiosulfate dehydrogenase